MREITVTEYTYIDKGILVDSNGEKYVVAEDDSGYMTILSGDVSYDDSDTFIAAAQEYHVTIPTEKFLTAIRKAREL